MPRPSPRTGAVLTLACALLLWGIVPAAADPIEDPPDPAASAPAASVPAASVPAASAPAAAATPEEAYDPLFDDEEPADDINDPIEGTNRAVLMFNDGVDRVVWKPVSKGVRKVVPSPARAAISNAVWHLDMPSVFVNDLLQGRPALAARTLARLLINSTVGLGGLMDPAGAIGLKRRESDFGTTLGHYGVGPGPYLVVPFIGPATVRDGFGGVVDSLMNPLTYLIGPGGDLILGVVFLNFGRGIAMQERHRFELEAIREGSVDYYSALRSLYLQSRDAAIRELQEHHAKRASSKRVGSIGGSPRAAALARSPGGPTKLRRSGR